MKAKYIYVHEKYMERIKSIYKKIEKEISKDEDWHDRYEYLKKNGYIDMIKRLEKEAEKEDREVNFEYYKELENIRKKRADTCSKCSLYVVDRMRNYNHIVMKCDKGFTPRENGFCKMFKNKR